MLFYTYTWVYILVCLSLYWYCKHHEDSPLGAFFHRHQYSRFRRWYFRTSDSRVSISNEQHFKVVINTSRDHLLVEYFFRLSTELSGIFIRKTAVRPISKPRFVFLLEVWLDEAYVLGSWLNIYIYIYIYREREREIHYAYIIFYNIRRES